MCYTSPSQICWDLFKKNRCDFYPVFFGSIHLNLVEKLIVYIFLHFFHLLNSFYKGYFKINFNTSNCKVYCEFRLNEYNWHDIVFICLLRNGNSSRQVKPICLLEKGDTAFNLNALLAQSLAHILKSESHQLQIFKYSYLYQFVNNSFKVSKPIITSIIMTSKWLRMDNICDASTVVFLFL